jgi:hypothetical protein
MEIRGFANQSARTLQYMINESFDGRPGLLSCSPNRFMVFLHIIGPRSSADRVLASEARSGSSSLPGGTIPLADQVRFSSGRGPAVGRLVWDQEVGSSILPAPTIFTLIIMWFMLVTSDFGALGEKRQRQCPQIGCTENS